MITFQQYPGTNILELVVDGRISKEDFDHAAQRIDELIEMYGRVRLIEVVVHMGQIQPAALWADLKFGPSHLKYFSHVAVVADAKWIEWITRLASPFLSAQTRCFHMNELDDARQWILHASEDGKP